MTDVTVAPSEDLTLRIPVTDADGNPVDVTDADGEFPVTDSPMSHTVLFAGTMSVADAADGQLDFVLAGSATAPFVNEYHVLYYELWLVTGGARTRLDSGKLTVA
jgi:hypothetical protein